MNLAPIITAISQIEGGLEWLKAELSKLQELEPVATVSEPAPKIIIPIGAVTGGMSIFGLDWDGSDDQGDEEPDGTPLKGAWGDTTHVKTLVGCALPIAVTKATFGSTAKPASYTVYVYSMVTNELVKAAIVDLGPAARVHRPIDGTYGLHNALGHLDYGLKKYSSYSKFPATFPVTFWIEDQHGLIKPIQGWDPIIGQVE